MAAAHQAPPMLEFRGNLSQSQEHWRAALHYLARIDVRIRLLNVRTLAHREEIRSTFGNSLYGPVKLHISNEPIAISRQGFDVLRFRR